MKMSKMHYCNFISERTACGLNNYDVDRASSDKKEVDCKLCLKRLSNIKRGIPMKAKVYELRKPMLDKLVEVEPTKDEEINHEWLKRDLATAHMKIEYLENEIKEAGRQSAVLCPDCCKSMELKEKILMGDECRSWTCNECEVTFHLVSDVVWDDMYNGYHFMKKELNDIAEKQVKLIEEIEKKQQEQVRKLRERNKEVIKRFNHNLTMKDENLKNQIKCAISVMLNVQEYIDEIFPDCAELKKSL